MDDRSSVVYDCGFATPITRVTVNDIPLILQAVNLHTTIAPLKAELDQLASGLELFGILSLVRANPDKMASLFVHSSADRLSAEVVIGLFEIEYWVNGSTRRIAEESVIQFWNEFAQDLGEGIIGKCSNCNTGLCRC